MSRLSASRLPQTAVVALTLAFAVSAIGPWPVGVFQDDGIYTVLAKSLATGQGYRFLQLPGAPNATHYPPGYPLLLAALWRLWPSFPENVALFKFANALLLAVAAGLGWHFARTRVQLGVVGATAVTVAFTACAPVILLTVMVLSEPMFLAVLFPVLALSERATDSGRPRDAAVAGAAGVLLSMVRSLGLLTVPATVLVLAWRRRWRAAMAAAVTGSLVALPWQLWVSAHAAEVPAVYIGKYGSYFGWFTDAVRAGGTGFVVSVARHNLSMLTAQGWASTATDGLPLTVRVLTTAGLISLFVWGLWLLARRAPVTAWFAVAYLGFVLVWPFAPARFTWGIWPIVGLCYVLAIRAIWLAAPRQASLGALLRGGGLAAAAAITVGYLTYNWRGVDRRWWTVVQAGVANRARPFAEWTLRHTAPGALLATDDDVLIHLYTGRATIPIGPFTAQEHLVRQTPQFATRQLQQILQAFPVDYVMASTDYGTYAVKGLSQSSPPHLRLETSLPSGAVYTPVRPAHP
jgi:hypothetical protein